MELLNELADLGITPAAMAKVQALFEQQQAQLLQRDAVLAEKDFKISRADTRTGLLQADSFRQSQ